MRTSERYKKGLDILKQIDEENYEAIVFYEFFLCPSDIQGSVNIEF